MGKEYLDLHSQLHRDHVLLGLGDLAGDLAGVFLFFTRTGSGICLPAAFSLGRAGLAGQFQGTVFRAALSGRPTVRVGVVPSELLQSLALRADVLIVLGIPPEVRPAPRAMGSFGLVEDWNMRAVLRSTCHPSIGAVP